MSELVGYNHYEYDHEDADKELCERIVCRGNLNGHKHEYGVEKGIEKRPIMIPFDPFIERFSNLEDPCGTCDDENQLQVA